MPLTPSRPAPSPWTEPQLIVHPEAILPTLPDGDLWVFAYGSLLWRPGFAYLQQLPARLFGYHRALCVWSHVHRGTSARPGMVLGLDRGGSCRGCLYRVAAQHKQAVADYLYAREMPTRIYHASICTVQAADGQSVNALTFVVNRQDPQYAGRLAACDAAAQVADACGLSGSSRDYLRQTLAHLEQLQIHDQHLLEIDQALRQRAEPESVG